MEWKFFPIAQFERFAPAWNALNSEAGGLPFLDSTFMLPLCDVFGGEGLKIAVCEGAQGPLAMGVLRRQGAMRWESFQPSQLPVGAWLMRPNQDFGRLLSSLAGSLPGMVLVVGVTQQDPSCAARPAESSSLHTLDYIQTARIPIAGSFDDYWSRPG